MSIDKIRTILRPLNTQQPVSYIIPPDDLPYIDEDEYVRFNQSIARITICMDNVDRDANSTEDLVNNVRSHMDILQSIGEHPHTYNILKDITCLHMAKTSLNLRSIALLRQTTKLLDVDTRYIYNVMERRHELRNDCYSDTEFFKALVDIGFICCDNDDYEDDESLILLLVASDSCDTMNYVMTVYGCDIYTDRLKVPIYDVKSYRMYKMLESYGLIKSSTQALIDCYLTRFYLYVTDCKRATQYVLDWYKLVESVGSDTVCQYMSTAEFNPGEIKHMGIYSSLYKEELDLHSSYIEYYSKNVNSHSPIHQ
ncbi:hypothetical protein HDU86_007579 [Geranomyces michiganensis]|nr:hypothetical protein HDU86_007579 [Geranomyces michiganensis]